jgi:hypothetical protein
MLTVKLVKWSKIGGSWVDLVVFVVTDYGAVSPVLHISLEICGD